MLLHGKEVNTPDTKPNRLEEQRQLIKNENAPISTMYCTTLLVVTWLLRVATLFTIIHS